MITYANFTNECLQPETTHIGTNISSTLIDSNINCFDNVFTSQVITGAASPINYIPTSSTSIVSEFLEQHTNVTEHNYNFQNQTTFENYRNNLLEEEKNEN
jgi:hypothetical protein